MRGEIQGVSERNGHLYFSLTDDDEGVRATISVSLFANVRFKLRPLLQRHRLRLADGMKVRLHGYLDFFAPSGRLGLKMSGIDPRYTLGELALQRDELVRRLVAAGLYDAQARLAVAGRCRSQSGWSRASAARPGTTSPTSWTASGFGFRIVACDARVQGEWAPDMVAAAIRTLGRRDLDVVLVVRGRRCPVGPGHVRRRGRGPGHRRPARSRCSTGLGHEVDRSVADDVAHLALKTPTACAGELVARVRRFRDELDPPARSRRGRGDDPPGVRRSGPGRAGPPGRPGHAAIGRRRGSRAAPRRAMRCTRQSRLAASASHALVTHDARRTVAATARVLAQQSAALSAGGERLAAPGPALEPAGGPGPRRRRGQGAGARSRADAGPGLEHHAHARRSIVRSAAELAPGDAVVTTLVDGEVHSRVEEVQGP